MINQLLDWSAVEAAVGERAEEGRSLPEPLLELGVEVRVHDVLVEQCLGLKANVSLGAEDALEQDLLGCQDGRWHVRLHAELVLGEDQVAVFLRAVADVDEIAGLERWSGTLWLEAKILPST